MGPTIAVEKSSAKKDYKILSLLLGRFSNMNTHESDLERCQSLNIDDRRHDVETITDKERSMRAELGG